MDENNAVLLPAGTSPAEAVWGLTNTSSAMV
jgi:hypothetical protein